jgi:phospholipase C
MHARRSVRQKCSPTLKQVMTLLLAVQLVVAVPVRARSQDSSNDDNTTSPIKHVIIIVGENRTFDHIFATYVPKAGQHVDNLLSKRIIKPDGTPGPNFSSALQFSAEDNNKFQQSPQSKASTRRFHRRWSAVRRMRRFPRLATRKPRRMDCPTITSNS